MIPRRLFEKSLLGFFAPIRQYLDEEGVTEVMINGPGVVFIERHGRLQRTDVHFSGFEELMSGLRNLAQYVGRPFDERHPVLEAHLPDGSRVEAIMPPAAPDGPCVSIRRFYRETLTAARLVALEALTASALSALEALVACKQNIVVSGGTSSGKTSLLNVLSSLCSADERIVTIEDARELQLQLPHVVRLEAQPGDHEGRGAISVRQLFKAALRMRPDRIVVGEVRGPEALDLVQAMTSGHGGCLSTVHASHARDATARLETMALMSDVALPLRALRPQVASAIDIIVHTIRLKSGQRCVETISELVAHDPDKGYEFVDLFVRDYARRDGQMVSTLRSTGATPTCIRQMVALGLQWPAA